MATRKSLNKSAKVTKSATNPNRRMNAPVTASKNPTWPNPSKNSWMKACITKK